MSTRSMKSPATGGMNAGRAGGSMSMNQVTPTQKGGGIPKGNADGKALGRAAAGRMDPHLKGKTVQ